MASDGVKGPRDQPEPKGKRPGGLTALERDKKKNRKLCSYWSVSRVRAPVAPSR